MDEEHPEDDEQREREQLLQDRFRLAVIGISESEAEKRGLTISQPVMAALCGITHKFTEHLGKELDLFARHASRKSVNMDDVILAARRNEDVAAALSKISQELSKQKETQVEKKRKKPAPSEAENHVVID